MVDVGHHDGYAIPRGILADCARRLSGLPVLFVGVRCPIEIILERRRNTGWNVNLQVNLRVRLSLLKLGCQERGVGEPVACGETSAAGNPPAVGNWRQTGGVGKNKMPTSHLVYEGQVQ